MTRNDKLLIAGIAAAGCGVAIFLLTTEKGKRLRLDIEDKSLDIYDFVSDRVMAGLDQMQDIAQNIRKVA